MLLAQLFILMMPAQTPGSAEAPLPAPIEAEPLAAEVAPTAAEAEAAGMPAPQQPVPAARPPRGQLRAAPVMTPTPPPAPAYPQGPSAAPYGQLRQPQQKVVEFRGVRPYVNGRRVSLIDFYAEIGRYDLVEDYEFNRDLKNWLLIGGAAGVAVATGGFFIGYFVWASDIVSSAGETDLLSTSERGPIIMIASIAVGLAGLVSAAVGLFMDSQPLSPAQARGVYDEWRDGYQVSQIDWDFTPVITGDGGGFAFSLTF